MSYTYATYKTAMAALLVVEETDADFVAILPTIIDQAEQRIYRELDLLSTVVRQTGTLTSGSRNFTLPTTAGRFVVTNGVNVVTPSAQTNPDLGTRNQCVAVSRDYMDVAWSSSTGASLPTNYAMITDQEMIFGPMPDAPYTVEIIGTIRPNALSVSNTTTYLSLYLPDLFLCASMVTGAGWQKNFGAQADDPKMAQSWEQQYQTHLSSANIEEQRKKYQSWAYGSLSPKPIASAN